MGYVMVTGGREAIRQAKRLVRYFRVKDAEGAGLQTSSIRKHMRLLIDRVMSEGGLYAPELAALALKQAEGDPYEAAFLLRSYRSTLSRNHHTVTVTTEDIRLVRRISSSFRDVPGGQILGPTRDYTHRLLDFSLRQEDAEEMKAFVAEFLGDLPPQPDAAPVFDKVVERLRREGWLPALPENWAEEEPFDLMRQELQIPSSRSARLQALSGAETGMLTALAYSKTRGFGANSHPTIGELRVGWVPVYIPHPLRDGDAEMLYVGEMMVTEVEMIHIFDKAKTAERMQLEIGYGLCFGHNEQKAIAMAIIEHSLEAGGAAPSEDEEFVLHHIDSLDSAGIMYHLNLPHYVTFHSLLDRIRTVQENRKEAEHAAAD